MRKLFYMSSMILLFSCCNQEEKIVQEGDLEYHRVFRDGVLIRSDVYDKKSGRKMEENTYRRNLTITKYFDEKGEYSKKCKGKETAIENRK